uniref:Uncharacterized protein n=1 Tax=uncultured marine group II/III euryarchaeote KM3_87_G11 TaxID=1456534 RepID=A0A075HU07_9EURY|nr:hypothetical protein [uncultured marine group II/III euryarchaeote KM3_87_G11]
MPKRKPDIVYEHRVTLGAWERKQLEPTIVAGNLTLLATGAAVLAAGAGVGVAGYAAFKWLQNNSGAIKWIAEHDDWLLKNPILQTLPNLTWLFGGDYSRWF